MDDQNATPPSSTVCYQLHVSGQLAPGWSEWFDGMVITPQPDGSTLLTGPVRDQAALYGLIRRLRDLNLTLLAVQQAAAG